MIPKTREDAAIAIKVCASAQGDRFDLTACALACAIHENPDRSVSDALDVLGEITQRTRHLKPDTPFSFGQLIFGELGFSGVQGDYDDPANGDLVDILTTRAGLPVGLGHIWRHAARVLDAPLHGTDSPGHFIMRLETSDGPVFIDPFEGGAIVDEDGLVQIARRAGLDAMTERMLRPVSDRVMAVRLQTNLVARARARGDVEAWFRAAYRRVILAPSNYQVALDYSQAAEAAGQLKTAYEWSQRASQLPGAPSRGHPEQADPRTLSLHYKLN
jgi:regulator of sirC expression with transglutaminase-like and TPR domain